MKIVRFKDLDFIPASHENPQDPAALKKVLLKRDDIPKGRIQMINWAKIPIGKTFVPHYHESMVEVFIIISGQVKVKIDSDEAILEKGDMVIAMERQVHTMTNVGEEDVDYFAMGVATSEGGHSVNI